MSTIPIQLDMPERQAISLADVLTAMNRYPGSMPAISKKLTLNLAGTIPVKDFDDDHMICMFALIGIFAIQSLTPDSLQRIADAARKRS
jgi:hypothetical protein